VYLLTRRSADVRAAACVVDSGPAEPGRTVYRAGAL